jgi:hypothetical protein
MEYMILIHTDNDHAPSTPDQPDFESGMVAWMAFNQRLIDGGHWIAGASLQPVETATTVRKSGGATTVTDGPFAETKEQFGGFYVISAKDLDEALELAGAVPMDRASVEVRPVAFRPDAPR